MTKLYDSRIIITKKYMTVQLLSKIITKPYDCMMLFTNYIIIVSRDLHMSFSRDTSHRRGSDVT